MKNFKKVISAVIALAMLVSSFATVGAASFTDVADTAAYAEAVDVLKALGIVSGIEENGTFVFKPENTITRAEAATMIVGALAMTEDAKASAGTTQFADVNELAGWATGYVNVGVAQKFIAGRGDGKFDPLANVTYAEMCVMLTSIAGYGDYAKKQSDAAGVWSIGYTTMAASTGINKGVAVADSVALTRGQVAMMIYNTLVTPMLGVSEYSIVGNTFAQLDGKNNRDFKTLLSDKFAGYVVTATVEKTATSHNLDAGTAELRITKADWWDAEDATVPNAVNTTVPVPVILEGIDLNNSLLQSGKAIITEDDMGDYHLEYFAVTGKTETKTFDAEEYVMQEDLGEANRYGTTGKVRFGSRYYDVDGATVYVNGVSTATLGAHATASPYPAASAVPNSTVDQYLGAAVGDITLINNDTDNAYDVIMVDNYMVAKVAAVEYENGETTVVVVNKETVGSANFSEIVVSDEALEEGDIILSVTKNGAEAELSSLVKDDIIAYKADFVTNTGSGALKDPRELVILATNDTVAGKVTGEDTDENTYSIDGTAYKKVAGLGTLTLSETYTAKLDPFGRLFSAEKDGTAAKMAIALSYDVSGNELLKILLPDGTTKSYEVASTATVTAEALPTSVPTAAPTSEPELNAYLGNGSVPVEGRVIEYKIKNSTSEVTSIIFKAPDVDALTTADEFNGRTDRLGGAEILSNTAVIDAQDAVADPEKASNYATFNPSEFKDGSTYKFAAWKSGTLTSLVVLTAIGNKFNDESRFAVVKKYVGATVVNDDDVYEVTALYNGDAEAQLLFVNDPSSTLAAGDAFFFETDNDGYIVKIFKIYDYGTGFVNMTNALGNGGVTASDYIDTTDAGWTDDIINSANKDIQLVEGYVIPGEDGRVTFAAKNRNYKYTDPRPSATPAVVNVTATPQPLQYVNTTVDLKLDGGVLNGGVAVYAVADDVQAYLYNVSDTSVVKEHEKFRKADVALMASTGLERYLEDGIIFNNGADMAGEANSAIAMIVDDVVVAIYAIK